MTYESRYGAVITPTPISPQDRLDIMHPTNGGGVGTHNDILQSFMVGRDTRFYRGHLGKLTLICVSSAERVSLLTI